MTAIAITRALVAGLLALAACSAEQTTPTSDGKVGASQTAATPDISLAGRWRIMSVDGQPPAGRADRERGASITFGDYHYGATVGCNHFGGLGLLADGHFATHSVSGTAIGCHNEIGRQEQALSQLFFARPAVRRLAGGRIRFESQNHSLEIERIGPNDSPPLPAGPEELNGTSWRIMLMDGQEASTNSGGRFLRFNGGIWHGMASCATLSGTWRRDGGRIVVGSRIISSEQNCPPELTQVDNSFRALMASSPRYVVGPNGELLVAGGGHALAGGRL